MPKNRQIEFFTTFSKFVSTRLLGEGGSGFVYEVKDDTGNVFAAKLLKKQGVTSDKRKRFKNEISFCQRSKHPNIISIVDSGVLVEDDIAVPFYIMAIYDSSLRDLIDAGLEPEEIIRLLPQLLDGVEAAHLQDVFHRDLKPENILYEITKAQLVLADFGIARFTEDELYTAVETKAQDRLANFQYAAPEQRIRGRDVDNRADIYAIGLILNEMFTHEIPQGTGYKTISSVSSDYAYLDEIVAMMIQQNPDNRPNSIKEVKALLRIHGEVHVSDQKLSALKSTVIPLSEIDDPLALSPVEIVDFEWDNGLLTLILNQPVNSKWRNALLNMGSYSSVMGKGPEVFNFENDRAVIQAKEEDVQRVINYFKSWMPQTTTRYKYDLEEEHRYKEEKERQEIQTKIEAEEAKARLRKNIKL